PRCKERAVVSPGWSKTRSPPVTEKEPRSAVQAGARVDLAKPSKNSSESRLWVGRGSQASPSPSAATPAFVSMTLAWSGLKSAGQLSHASPTPSPSSSGVAGQAGGATSGGESGGGPSSGAMASGGPSTGAVASAGGGATRSTGSAPASST